MPKRPCPFGYEDLIPQSKVHVGEKEINNGVFREERMKQVYEKTLNLLKAGALKYSNKMNKSEHIDEILFFGEKSVITTNKCGRKLKQMLLNNKLQLETTDDETIQNSILDLCGCCRIMDPNGTNQCYYCNQILCKICLVKCIICLEYFCETCSLSVHDSDEQHVCLNCYK